MVEEFGIQWCFPESCIGEDVEGGLPIIVSSHTLGEFRKGGGGVWRRLSKEFQKSTPAEFLTAWCLKLSDAVPPEVPSAGKFILAVDEDWGNDGWREDDEVFNPGSLSRTWRITSASSFASLSTGATSSNREARTRAKVFVLGCNLRKDR